ncbi:hypothetical protein MKW92_030495 [Papaver armeniacum]|nr:hypothetical protein MKW92_030495 [Papaver armeniacum]
MEKQHSSQALCDKKKFSYKPIYAETKRIDSIVSHAASSNSNHLEIASPLEMKDKALQKFENDNAIAFRCIRTEGLFSFCEDGHQECCRVKKVRPLRRELESRLTQHLEGLDGYMEFFCAMNVSFNLLHSQGYVSTQCEPCTRAKECGLHQGNAKQEEGVSAQSSNDSNWDREFAQVGELKEPWIVVLCVPWCQFCQDNHMCKGYVLIKKSFNWGASLQYCASLNNLHNLLKYPSEKRDVCSLMGFVNALR